jgi:UDP-N-acetyl-D-mannosaminuronate dehydrogenase
LLHLVGDLFELYDDARTYKTLKFKRGFLVSNCSAIKITLCLEQSVASELRVERACSVTWTVQLSLRYMEDKSVLNYDVSVLLEDHRNFKHIRSMHLTKRTFPV